MSYGTVGGRVCTVNHSSRCSSPSEVKGNKFEFLWNSIKRNFQSTTLLLSLREAETSEQCGRIQTKAFARAERREMFSVLESEAGRVLVSLSYFPPCCQRLHAHLYFMESTTLS